MHVSELNKKAKQSWLIKIAFHNKNHRQVLQSPPFSNF